MLKMFTRRRPTPAATPATAADRPARTPSQSHADLIDRVASIPPLMKPPTPSLARDRRDRTLDGVTAAAALAGVTVPIATAVLMAADHLDRAADSAALQGARRPNTTETLDVVGELAVRAGVDGYTALAVLAAFGRDAAEEDR